ncbi:MAG: hypothetical protein HQ503_14065 [Rhodospirillales bacterium]|nr:hypothetical protein [Rhodospirillales bacterium]
MRKIVTKLDFDFCAGIGRWRAVIGSTVDGYFRLVFVLAAIAICSVLSIAKAGAEFLYAPQGCEFAITFPEKPAVNTKGYKDRSGNPVGLSVAEIRFLGAVLQSSCEAYQSIAPFVTLQEADMEALIRRLAKRMKLRDLKLSHRPSDHEKAFDVEYQLKSGKSGYPDLLGKAVWVFGDRSRLIAEIVVPTTTRDGETKRKDMIQKFFGSIYRK